jgi:hypothetical protein
MVCGIAISFQSSLEFLGLGDPTASTWGVMINDGFRSIYRQPLALIWPTLAISFTIGGFVLLGNALRDALEDQVKVKEKQPKAPKAASSTRSPVAVARQSSTVCPGTSIVTKCWASWASRARASRRRRSPCSDFFPTTR